MSAASPGAIVGRYVLVEKLERGAMGEVWVGLDPDLDRKVAIKLLRADRIGGPDERAQQGAEARAMARLAHPNVVTIHDVGELGPLRFIAMEFIEGESLAAWIDRGPHPWAEVLAIMRQAAAGLAAAHGVGLVHRDFKPANVMIGRDGRVRVLDFGLARHEGSVAPASQDDDDDDDDVPWSRRLSASAAIRRASMYMSPEQRQGARVDARSDLYSFCVISFEALYGVRPFASDGEVVEHPEHGRERVPAWIHAILMRGLAREPQQRFPDMDALLAALERSPEQRRQRRWGVAGASAGVAAVLGLALVFMPEHASDPCEAAGDTITAEWDAEARARLRGRIDSVAVEGSLAGRRVIEGVDRHVAEWAKSRELLCRDRTAQRLTARLQATREACLSRDKEAMRALVRLGERDDDRALLEGLAARPFAGLRSLGDPTRCVDLPASLDDRPVLSEDQRSARLELQLALALIDVEQLSPAAIARVKDGCEADEDLECALLLGRVAAMRGDRADAEAPLHAITVAATHGEPELAAKAWLALVELEVEALAKQGDAIEAWERASSVERASQLVAYADALLPTHDTASRSELALLAGGLALIGGRRDHRALLDRAIDAAGPREPDLLAAMLETRARLHERDGKKSEAAIDRAQAQELLDSVAPSSAEPAESMG